MSGCARARAALRARAAVAPHSHGVPMHWRVSRVRCDGWRAGAGWRGRAAGAGLENLWRELFRHAFEACDMNVRVSLPAVGVVVCYVDVGVLLYGVASVRPRKEIPFSHVS